MKPGDLIKLFASNTDDNICVIAKVLGFDYDKEVVFIETDEGNVTEASFNQVEII